LGWREVTPVANSMPRGSRSAAASLSWRRGKKSQNSRAPLLKSKKTVHLFSYLWDELKPVASRRLVPAHEIADQKWAAVLCYEVRL